MYQFIHISSYSSTGSKKSASTANVTSIVGEAARQAGYVKHLDEVHEPVNLYGCSPIEAGDAAKAWGKRNKIRKDGHVLLAGVISVPSEFQNWPQYKVDCIDWLQEKYGTRLLSIVEHTDEDHPHLHFYAVPLDGERFDALHEGEKARNALRALKQPTGAQNKAYKEAMKGFQRQFHSDVSENHGLSKDGPKKTRKTRAVYLAEKEATTLVSAAYLEKDGAVEQGRQERFRIIKQTKREATEYAVEQNKLASDAAEKINFEAIDVKRQAEMLGLRQGQKTFERRPFIKKIRAVFYGLAQLANKQLKRIQQQLRSTKAQANSSLLAAKRTIAEMDNEISNRDKTIRHISNLYEEVCKQNRDLIWEAKRPQSLNFSESVNSPAHAQTPK